VIWCIGFAPDFAWLDAPVFNGRGHPQHASIMPRTVTANISATVYMLAEKISDEIRGLAPRTCDWPKGEGDPVSPHPDVARR
jgi:hypothetical protein